MTLPVATFYTDKNNNKRNEHTEMEPLYLQLLLLCKEKNLPYFPRVNMSPSVRRSSSEVCFLTIAGGSQQKYFDLTMSPSKVAVSKHYPHKKQKPVTVQTQDGRVGNTSSMCESLRKPISRNRWQFSKQINKANDSRESPCGWNRLHG